MILRNGVMLVAGAALATGQIVQAQAPADRHPAYDAAVPDIPGIYPEATELKITASPDNRIFLGSARPFHEEITPEAVELKAWRGERSSQYYIHAQDVKNTRAIVDETLAAPNALPGGRTELMP